MTTVEEAFAAWRLEHPETAGWPLDAFRAGWVARGAGENVVIIETEPGMKLICRNGAWLPVPADSPCPVYKP